MRRLNKGDEPEYLMHNGERLKNEYLASLNQGRSTTPWRHPEIRNSLNVETSERCAYCDSFVRAVAYGHVEHIEPKAKVPEKVVTWQNLTVACPRCNQNKSDYHNDALPLLNPYRDNPEDHLVFAGPLVRARPGNDRAWKTVRQLKLYRIELTEARTRRLLHVEGLVEGWARAPAGEVKETLAEFVRDDLDSGEYYETVLSYLRQVRFPVDPPVPACPESSTTPT